MLIMLTAVDDFFVASWPNDFISKQEDNWQFFLSWFIFLPGPKLCKSAVKSYVMILLLGNPLPLGCVRTKSIPPNIVFL